MADLSALPAAVRDEYEALKHEHPRGCRVWYPDTVHAATACDCGADEKNARLLAVCCAARADAFPAAVEAACEADVVPMNTMADVITAALAAARAAAGGA